MKLWREGGRGGGLRKQRLTSERCGCWSRGQAGRLEAGSPVFWAQNPSGLTVCPGELTATALNGGSISSLWKQGRPSLT